MILLVVTDYVHHQKYYLIDPSFVGVLLRLRLALELLTNRPAEEGICRYSEPSFSRLAGAAGRFESSVGDLTCRPPDD